MTYVSCISLDTNRRLKEYQVEVITFDGESEIVYVIARTADEAQEKAAAQVPDADYTMVQGSCEL
ncbi:MAG: hypothetical protein NC301_09390 [Bacteroides sp.]|nr:hypothetical protein [Bacteroides sp.]MCM1380266.1 hypothetical protein [Bacteroides sp.]MCM1446597.1 hypothetical protein [Prevotella sp.]